MLLKFCITGLLLALLSLPLVSVVSANVQTFESDVGTIQINLPYDVVPGSTSSGSSLQLVKPGTTKPIISINIDDPSIYKDLEDFAISFIGSGHELEKMTTNDGKAMLFNALQGGNDRDGNPTYTYRGFIDYTKEKGKYIIIHAPNNVIYQGDIIATYDENQFASICQSFAIK
jgi:hypothetical protein